MLGMTTLRQGAGAMLAVRAGSDIAHVQRGAVGVVGRFGLRRID